MNFLIKRSGVIISVLFVLSCKETGVKQKVDKTEYVKFRFNPHSEAIYSYDASVATEIYVGEKAEAKKSLSKVDMGSEYKFTKDSSGSLSGQLIYRSFKVTIRDETTEDEIDAEAAAGSGFPAKKMFSAFKDAQFSFKLDSSGNISALAGVNELKNKMQAIAKGDEAANEMLNGSISQYVDQAFFKNTIEQNLKLFTSRSLKPGDTILVSQPIDGGIKFNNNLVYTLRSVNNGIAQVDAKSDINLDNQPIEVQNMKVTATLKGFQTSVMNIEVATGMIENSNSTLELEGLIIANMREVPLKIKVETVVRRK